MSISKQNQIFQSNDSQIPDLNSGVIPLSYNTNIKWVVGKNVRQEYLDNKLNNNINTELNNSNIDAILDNDELIDIPKEKYYLETYKGGSTCRVKREIIDPLENHTEGKITRGDRREITYFTNRSRNNLLDQLNMINQDKIPEDKVLMITLTLDPKVSHNGDCKRFMNNFLVQLRKRLYGLVWFYTYKMEFQKNGMVHFHLVILGLKHISHYWIRHTWSRITLGQTEYNRRCSMSNDRNVVFKSLVITQVEKSKGWNKTNQYFSKTLGYVSKEMEEHKEIIRKYKERWGGGLGRFWSIGNRKIYNKFVDRITFEITEGQYYKLRRCFLQILKSRWMKKYKDEFDHKKWKKFEKLKKNDRCSYTGYEVEHGTSKVKYKTMIKQNTQELRLFTSNQTLEKLFLCLFNIDNIFDTNTNTSDKVVELDITKYLQFIQVMTIFLYLHYHSKKTRISSSLELFNRINSK